MTASEYLSEAAQAQADTARYVAARDRHTHTGHLFNPPSPSHHSANTVPAKNGKHRSQNMKPLELTIYPHAVDGGMDCIEDSEGTFRIHRELDDFAQDKRFTDAELAAEYWCEEKSLGDVRDWIKTSPGYKVLEPVLLERVLTLHRFATLPHYDEASL